jgi:hypothetical protein
MRYTAGRIVSVTIDHATLPPGISAVVNPHDTIRVTGTPTQWRQFELRVPMTGLSSSGEIVTGSSSRELIVSSVLRIGGPAPVQQGVPFSAQLPLDYASGRVSDVTATGLPAGLSISPSGLITGTTYASGTFHVAYSAKGLPHGTPPHISPISRTVSIGMSVAPWGVQIPASEMPGGRFYEYYSWQMPIQYVNGETVNVTAAGLPEGLSVSPTGLVSGYPGRTSIRPSSSR